MFLQVRHGQVGYGCPSLPCRAVFAFVALAAGLALFVQNVLESSGESWHLGRSASETKKWLGVRVHNCKLTRSPSGNARPQSSRLDQPLWTDPGLKSGTSVGELISN